MLNLTWYEWIGWSSTMLFCTSLFMKDRRFLHGLGAVSTFFNLIYVFEISAWPMVFKWSVATLINIHQLIKYKKIHREQSKKQSP